MSPESSDSKADEKQRTASTSPTDRSGDDPVVIEEIARLLREERLHRKTRRLKKKKARSQQRTGSTSQTERQQQKSAPSLPKPKPSKECEDKEPSGEAVSVVSLSSGGGSTSTQKHTNAAVKNDQNLSLESDWPKPVETDVGGAHHEPEDVAFVAGSKEQAELDSTSLVWTEADAYGFPGLSLDDPFPGIAPTDECNESIKDKKGDEFVSDFSYPFPTSSVEPKSLPTVKRNQSPLPQMVKSPTRAATRAKPTEIDSSMTSTDPPTIDSSTTSTASLTIDASMASTASPTRPPSEVKCSTDVSFEPKPTRVVENARSGNPKITKWFKRPRKYADLQDHTPDRSSVNTSREAEGKASPVSVTSFEKMLESATLFARVVEKDKYPDSAASPTHTSRKPVDFGKQDSVKNVKGVQRDVRDTNIQKSPSWAQMLDGVIKALGGEHEVGESRSSDTDGTTITPSSEVEETTSSEVEETQDIFPESIRNSSSEVKLFVLKEEFITERTERKKVSEELRLARARLKKTEADLKAKDELLRTVHLARELFEADVRHLQEELKRATDSEEDSSSCKAWSRTDTETDVGTNLTMASVPEATVDRLGIQPQPWN